MLTLSLALACTTSKSPPSEVAPVPDAAPPAPAVSLDGTPAEVCARVAGLAPPAQDGPTAQERDALAGCDAEALYYGIGTPKDPVAARKCAFLGRDEEAGFGGSSILMMLYANGLGVPRNEPLAIAIACEISWAEAEREGRVEHLVSRSRDPNAPPDFDLCDDITSGFMGGICAGHEQRVQAVGLDARRAAAIDRVPPGARAALTALDQAATAFFQARLDNEVDLSGTARAAFVIEEESALSTGFVTALEQILDPSFPPAADASALAEADAALNAAYRAIMAWGEGRTYGTVTAEGVRTTERAWLAYRDAWAAFGTAARPDSTPETWKTWATRARTAQLEEFAL